MLRSSLLRRVPSVSARSSSILSSSHSHSFLAQATSHSPLSQNVSRRSFAMKVAVDKKKAGGPSDKDKDAAKKKKKKKDGDDESGGLKSAAELGLLEKVLEEQLSQSEFVDRRTPVELALDHEYAKEYNRRCMRETKIRHKAQTNFMKSRWTAINALPVALRNEALKEDMTPWPKGFQPIPWTAREYVKRFGPQATEAAAPKK